MRAISTGLFLGLLTLGGCAVVPGLGPKAAFEHYDECEAQTSSFTEMVACGKQKRIAYCDSMPPIGPYRCSSEGNQVVQFADALAQSVASHEMSEAEAKRRFAEFKVGLISSHRRDAAIAAAGDSAHGPTTCIRNGNVVNCF